MVYPVQVHLYFEFPFSFLFLSKVEKHILMFACVCEFFLNVPYLLLITIFLFDLKEPDIHRIVYSILSTMMLDNYVNN